MLGATRVRISSSDAASPQQKRAAQARKIYEIRSALESSGFKTLDRQADALGLRRSTTWNLLSGRHKQSGMRADVINAILNCPKLPDPVRLVIEDYVQRKLGGEYGHTARSIARFRAQLRSTKQPLRFVHGPSKRISEDSSLTS